MAKSPKTPKPDAVKEQATGPTDEDLEGLRARHSAFLYTRLKTLSRAILAQNLFMGLLIVAFVAHIFLNDKVTYFGITPDLRTVPLKALSEPVLDETGVARWTQRTITQALSVTSDNFQDVLVDARRDFDDLAYNTLIASLNENDDLAKLKDGELVYSMSMAPIDTAMVVKQGLVQGVRVWRVEVPVLLTRRSVHDPDGTSIRLRAIAAVKRVSELQNASGIRIAQIVFEPLE